MGVSTVTAARILKGQLHHNSGEETRLEMDKFPFVALSKVSCPRYTLHMVGCKAFRPPGSRGPIATPRQKKPFPRFWRLLAH